MHLPLIGRRRAAPVGPPAEHGGSVPALDVLLEPVRARERAALTRLGAATGGRPLCAPSPVGEPVPSAKYHEGAAAALAEARRLITSTQEGAPGAQRLRGALLDVSARWRAQAGTLGRAGPDWVAYLAGGLHELDRMIDDHDRTVDHHGGDERAARD